MYDVHIELLRPHVWARRAADLPRALSCYDRRRPNVQHLCPRILLQLGHLRPTINSIQRFLQNQRKLSFPRGRSVLCCGLRALCCFVSRMVLIMALLLACAARHVFTCLTALLFTSLAHWRASCDSVVHQKPSAQDSLQTKITY